MTAAPAPAAESAQDLHSEKIVFFALFRTNNSLDVFRCVCVRIAE